MLHRLDGFLAFLEAETGRFAINLDGLDLSSGGECDADLFFFFRGKIWMTHHVELVESSYRVSVRGEQQNFPKRSGSNRITDL